ncbi:MAG: alpha/beta fold hydrolase [Anaerolineae bacterium]|nr:alpha/beta fold hydrolase [Anaerolineae bacterium]
MNRRLFFLVFLLYALLASTSARAETLTFQIYTQRDGLAADYITHIAFAPDGTTWLGTMRGATRVRDAYWVTYTAAHGLGSSTITGIAIGAAGKTYVATSGGGLTLFDGAERKTYTTANSAIPSNYLTAVAVDKQGRVWIGTLGHGAARLENEQWSKYSFSSNYITTLALDANGNPWLATNDGVFFFDGRVWARLDKASGLASNRVNAITFARDGRVWFGTDDGVTVFDGKTLRTYTRADGLVDNVVRAIAVDAQNRVWVGTLRGLALFDGKTWKTYTRADGLAANHITALAFDARENLWVGTTHGLNVLGATLQRAPTFPVVLVHGWHSAESDHIDDSEFHYFRHYLERDGFPVFYATGISPYKTLHQNAETLRDVIAEVKAHTGARQIDLIAFSMGGLNARAYLESTLYQNDVRRVIILGTPQAGVRMWYPLLTRELEDRPDEPSAIELTPEYAALFNRTHAPRATVPYDLLIGDARTQSGLDFLKHFPASDGLIEVWSAHALSGPNVRRLTNADVHAWDPLPIPLNPTSYLYPDQTYTRWIRNALRDPDARPLGFATTSVEPIAPRNITPMNVDSLRAGETLTRAVVLDANRAVRFFARWNSGDIDLHLRAPDGTRYTPEQLRDAAYIKADVANFIGYAISRAPVGTWSLIATRKDKGNKPLVLTTYADLDADVRLDVETDRATYALGAPVTIRATLANKAPAEMRAKILWLGDGVSARTSSIEVPLRATNEPGTYAVTLTDLSRGGYYLVRVTARAANLMRERQLIFGMSPATAKFTGETRARIEKGALVIETGVNVARAGAFALSATVRGTRGQLIASLTAPLTLKQGTQVASITIPGRDIRARGIEGPYNIELVLMDASWAAIVVDELSKALTTEAYTLADFTD